MKNKILSNCIFLNVLKNKRTSIVSLRTYISVLYCSILTVLRRPYVWMCTLFHLNRWYFNNLMHDKVDVNCVASKWVRYWLNYLPRVQLATPRNKTTEYQYMMSFLLLTSFSTVCCRYESTVIKDFYRHLYIVKMLKVFICLIYLIFRK